MDTLTHNSSRQGQDSSPGNPLIEEFLAYLQFERGLSDPKPGDILAILTAGAYGFCMSSQYNSRPRPAEVMVSAGKHRIIRRRETLDDLLSTTPA